MSRQDGAMFLWILRVQKIFGPAQDSKKQNGKKFLIQQMFLDLIILNHDVFPSAMGESSEIVTNTDGFRDLFLKTVCFNKP